MKSPFEKFKTHNWMQDYANMEAQNNREIAVEFIPELDAEIGKGNTRPEETNLPPAAERIIEAQQHQRSRKLTDEEKEERRFWMRVQQWLAYQEYLKTEKRAKKIRKLNPNQFKFNQDSAEVFIVRTLVKHPNGLHINQIMEAVEKLGYQSKSKHHHYSHFSRILNRRAYLFERVSKGTFKLRGAFSKSNPTIAKQKGNTAPILPKFDEVVHWFMSRYAPKEGVKVDKLVGTMNYLGVKCSAKSIEKQLGNSPKFERRGEYYAVVKQQEQNK